MQLLRGDLTGCAGLVLVLDLGVETLCFSRLGGFIEAGELEPRHAGGHSECRLGDEFLIQLDGLRVPSCLMIEASQRELCQRGNAIVMRIGGLFQINVRLPAETNGEFTVSVELPDGTVFSGNGEVAVTSSPVSDPVMSLAPRLYEATRVASMVASGTW